MTILTIILLPLSGMAALMAITLLAMGGANASPRTVRQLKFMIVSVVLIELAALAGAIVLLAMERSGWAAAVAALPIAVSVGLWTMLWLIKY